MNEFEIHAFGRPVCTLDAAVIGEILNADTSPGQQEEYEKIMDILRDWSEERGGSVFIDVGNVLSDGFITVQKTRALPILLSAIRHKGALYELPPAVIRTMTVYSNMQAAAMEFRYKSLLQLQRLSEAVCSGLEGIESGDMTPGEAAERIIKALPEDMIALDNLSDIRVLECTVRGIERVTELWGESSELIEDFIIAARPLLDRIEEETGEENEENL